MVFYKFATPFSKDANAQFVTPLPLIDFLVNIVNPRNGETVIDPTVGIADFLSVSYVNSNSKLDDNNIFGMDIDEQMVMLATLNMLLNGDGNAKIKAQADLIDRALIFISFTAIAIPAFAISFSILTR